MLLAAAERALTPQLDAGLSALLRWAVLLHRLADHREHLDLDACVVRGTLLRTNLSLRCFLPLTFRVPGRWWDAV